MGEECGHEGVEAVFGCGCMGVDEEAGAADLECKAVCWSWRGGVVSV